MPDKNKIPASGDSNRKAGEDKNANDVVKAHLEADKDISKDPEWTATSKNDDLDEGETARLGEDVSGII